MSLWFRHGEAGHSLKLPPEPRVTLKCVSLCYAPTPFRTLPLSLSLSLARSLVHVFTTLYTTLLTAWHTHSLSLFQTMYTEASFVIERERQMDRHMIMYVFTYIYIYIYPAMQRL